MVVGMASSVYRWGRIRYAWYLSRGDVDAGTDTKLSESKRKVALRNLSDELAQDGRRMKRLKEAYATHKRNVKELAYVLNKVGPEASVEERLAALQHGFPSTRLQDPYIKVTNSGELVGHAAADYHIPRLFPSAVKVYDGSRRGAGGFDEVWFCPDDKTFLVIECKAQPQVDLGQREFLGLASEQGTPEYFHSILDGMRAVKGSRSTPSAQQLVSNAGPRSLSSSPLARVLAAASADNRVIYMRVTGSKKSDFTKKETLTRFGDPGPRSSGGAGRVDTSEPPPAGEAVDFKAGAREAERSPSATRTLKQDSQTPVGEAGRSGREKQVMDHEREPIPLQPDAAPSAKDAHAANGRPESRESEASAKRQPAAHRAAGDAQDVRRDPDGSLQQELDATQSKDETVGRNNESSGMHTNRIDAKESVERAWDGKPQPQPESELEPEHRDPEHPRSWEIQPRQDQELRSYDRGAEYRRGWEGNSDQRRPDPDKQRPSRSLEK